ncbi:hypothetical protein PV350_10900 [Streptomyces sp. PA03-6a]|nr:hypothetical protein [Streptomyces sp. PA03-6a]
MYVEPVPEYRRQGVGFQLDGRLYRGAVTERREPPDGRVAVHVLLWPALPKQLLDGDVVRIRRGDVPPDRIPKYESLEPGLQPRVQVRVGGQWHDGVVWHKIRYRDGRHAVQVKVAFLEGDGFPVVYWHTYWWNPDAIRLVR